MRIVSSKEMKEIEVRTWEKYGMSEELIIENVGSRAAQYLYDHYFKHHDFGEVVLLVGRGNNGADGLAIARHLRHYGIASRAFMLFPRDEWSKELAKQLARAEAYGVRISELKSADEFFAYLSTSTDGPMIIDAIFGTGVRLPLSERIQEVIKIANQFAKDLVAIDIPSGIYGDTGAIEGTAINASLTLAIGLPKMGHFIDRGPLRIGKLHILDVGFPRELLRGGNKVLVSTRDVATFKRKRSRFAHKNSFGHCLIIGGSPGLTGALCLASRAALKTGTGLVTATTWEKSYQELASRAIPEMMLGRIPVDTKKAQGLLDWLHNYEAVVIGPGLGRSENSRTAVVETLKRFEGPVVLDADALNVLSFEEDHSLIQRRRGVTILTPHLGEFARMTGVKVEKIMENPLTHLLDAVEKTGAAILLKGPSSFLAVPSGDIYVSYRPNEGMAKGGSGDVLAGIIGGLLAQRGSELKRGPRRGPEEGRDMLYQAVCLGLVVHSLAGEVCAKVVGARSMSAGDIIDHIGQAFNKLDEVTHGKNTNHHA